MSTNQFELFLTGLQRRLQREYDRGINRDLSKHQSHDLFIRNVCQILQQAKAETLAELEKLEIQDGEQVLTLMDKLDETLLHYALKMHRSSCAVSNFPEEHNPSQDYIARTLVEIEKGKQGFEEAVLSKVVRV